MSYAGFEATTRHTLAGGKIQISDDGTPFSDTDARVDPGGGSVVCATSVGAPSFEMPGFQSILGTVCGSEVENLKVVRRIGLVRDGHLLVGDRLAGELCVAGVGRFEVQLGLRLTNRGLPRSFASIAIR
jgi:hypothetical protein